MYGDDHDIVLPTIGTVFDAIAKHPDDENTTDVEKKAVHYFFHTVVATVDSKVTKEEWMTNKTVMHVLGKSWAPHMALAAILMSRASDLNNILKNQKKDDNDGKTSKKKVFDDKDKKALYREHKGYLDKFNEWYNQSLVDQTVHDRFAAWDKETKMTREPKESAAEKRAKNGPPDKRRALEDDQSDDDIDCSQMLTVIGFHPQVIKKSSAGSRPRKMPRLSGMDDMEDDESEEVTVVHVATDHDDITRSEKV